MTTIDVDDLYRWETVQQAKNRTGLGYSTIRSKIRKGELLGFHAGSGRRLYVRTADINALMTPIKQGD